MKYLRKVFAITLLFCVIVSYGTVGVNAAFYDMGDESLDMTYVDILAEKGIIKGYTGGNFGPDDVCTRGQFLTFLWRASGEPSAEAVAEIKDITGDEYYATAVNWAYKNGITKIYSDGTFRAEIPTDREHAAYYLYNWAKLFGKSDVTKTMSMNKYIKDGVLISADSRTAFSWAMANGFLKDVDGEFLYPQNSVNRLWTVETIGKLLETHVCVWSEWSDNGDGTHTRVCNGDSSHKEVEEHQWNDGELTIKATETKKGLVTYTCTQCKLSKTEEVAPGTEFTVRADLEEALANIAFAYYSKGDKMQYDSSHLTDMTAYLGGLIRMTPESAPEAATKDNSFYSVCSCFTYLCYQQGLGIKDLGETTWPFGFSTAYIFSNADNQNQEQVVSSKLIEPLTEDDVDTVLFRWVDYDKYSDYKGESTISRLMSYGVLESSSFTDFAPGLTFKDDGFEGEVHYSYYDEEGNRLSYEEARSKYLDPYTAQLDKVFRPGDMIVNHSHAMLYVGNDRLVDCAYADGGGKIDLTKGVEKREVNGSMFANRLLSEKVKASTNKSIIALRPLEFVVKSGYDDDPGNDIVKDFEIPEATISRIKYPSMDIDRTVDITDFGTAVKGENLTYTIEISNKTNLEHYQTWKGENALQDYENLVVTEKIPEGCEYVQGSATNNGKYENGIITWNIEKIVPGATVELKYSVKVTAEVGTVIVNGEGMVDNIPSNVLKNTVGLEKLSETSVNNLSKISESGNDALNAFGSDTAFANAIYDKIGTELDLPSVSEITKSLFPIKAHVPGYSQISWVPQLNPVNLYENKVVSGESAPLNKMVIDRFWGGRKFYVGDELKWNFADNCIKEFKPEFLEAGDIIIYAITEDKTNLSYDFATVGVMVYDGKKLLSSTKTPEGTAYQIFEEDAVESELTKLFKKEIDIFFALRPSQAK